MSQENTESVRAKRKKRRDKQRENKRNAKREEALSAYTNGHADFTPFSAITGKEKISKPTLTNPQKRVGGSFNG